MNTPPPEQQNRRSTRSALAEIPTRLGMLSVSENGHLPSITAIVPNSNTGGLWNVSLNLPSSYVSPSPSPDEMVIQQRGRRHVPATWSPDVEQNKQNGMSTRDRTPVKASPVKSTIVLRSTPRKRLLLSDPKELFPTPEKCRKVSPNSKKCRTEKPSSHSSSPLQAALKGLSQDQLIDIIQQLVDKHMDLGEEIKEIMPAPDIRPLEEQLSYLKKNIFKSLPNSRLTSKTDSPAYSRAATHVLAFKKCVLEQGRQLVESQHWGSVLEYVFLAWTYVRGTPLWDNPPHNAARRQCFKSLAAQCMTALKKGTWSTEECDRLQEKLERCAPDSEDIQACMKQLSVLRKKL
ncbi:hypothetical protein B7P43_G13079 [Cryptotermes secundus]|uniref:Tethering factor for nuclear proteasome STS1 n=1 Tax=Cryptotermes secundus TaxID=105785 RepID=A0A2J7RPT5_9NEOP|nr:uncharacterized protein LOC111865774 [Cryptotermes secundus]PNF42850.1 hypothetical protein B7P43_G13079 [Cryptotermes secundus]PNF42851.1 hypothetical protein B7P43_G13079 [Cryptotermes secundus]PNF42852.1 hypothetical protein B7P43_G13079 [Cryptotermes secundus]